MISFCLTTYNRTELLFEAIESLVDDPRVTEVVVCDDCSEYEYFHKVQEYCEKRSQKIKLFRNVTNLGMQLNKATAVRKCSEHWVLLGDSDNVFNSEYINALPDELESDTIYCPSFARPKFDYTKYSGQVIDAVNARKVVSEEMGNCLFNTCNYVVHRESYLRTFKPNVAHVASDTIWFNYNWLMNGGAFYVVPGMEYFHRVHDGSGFLQNVVYNMQKAEEVKKLILRI